MKDPRFEWIVKNPPPVKSIRYKCLECNEYNPVNVRNCYRKDCPLYPFRMGRSVKGKSPLKAIRRNCIECMGSYTQSAYLVRNCPSEKYCVLWRFRFGKNPNLKGKRGGGNFKAMKNAPDMREVDSELKKPDVHEGRHT